MKTLLHCIKHLGIWNGFRYWRLIERTIKDPSLCPKIWLELQYQGHKIAHTEPEMAQALYAFADRMKESYCRYMKDRLEI